MIFNTRSKQTVNYDLLEDDLPVPHFFKTELELINPKINCPATNSLVNRVYGYKPPVTVNIEFGMENNKPYFKYDFNNSDMKINDFVSDIIFQNIQINVENDRCVFQFLSHLAFVTDSKHDIEMVTYPSDDLELENCNFIVGGFYINKWIRPFNFALIQTNPNKPSYAKLNIDKNCVYVTFSNKVNLTNEPFTESAIKYSKYMHNISAAYNNLIKISNRIIKHRPRRLL